MKVDSFLGVIDLGFGVILLATVYLTVGICSLLTNIYDWNKAPNKISGVFTIICLTYMMLIWIYASYGSYNSDLYPDIISRAFINWTIFIITWIILFLLSLHSNTSEYVCVKGHCPESLWLYNNTWNDIVLYEGFVMGLNKFEDKINITKAGDYSDNISSSSLAINADEPISLLSRKRHKSYNDVNWNKIIIIINVVYYMVIFTYGWIVLYSYNIELKSLIDCEPDYKDKDSNV